MSITRRDFLNGVALTVAAGLTPAAQLAAQLHRYPPALTGLRGHHQGSFEAAHAFARDGQKLRFDGLPVDERYDLVVVGGGISGLAAAYFYRRAVPQARILVLDNHDDFGGHAKRNEFTLDGRRLIGYGGSQSIQSPNAMWQSESKALLRELGVDVTRFDTAFDQDLYRSLGLSHGLFFDRQTFGRDVLVAGAGQNLEGDAVSRRAHNARPVADVVAEFPISADSKRQLLALYAGQDDPLPGRSADEKLRILKKTSYRDYLVKICGCSEQVADCFQGRTLGYFGLGADSVPAADVRTLGYPGFAALALKDDGGAFKEPYIYHFPDGNASLARLLVRALIPAAAPGSTMDDVVLAPFDYAALDRPGQPVRIRLDSMCLDVRNEGGVVRLGYVRGGERRRVEARHAVLACFHMIIPHIMPELPEPQRLALAQNVKVPMVYTNVLIRNWQAFANLKVSGIAAPASFHSNVSLDFPVSLGGYRHPRDPSEPILVHMVHVPNTPNSGAGARDQLRAGRYALEVMEYAEFEKHIKDDLDRMLGAGGFSSARDVAAITVNRWSHGYSYVANSLFDPEDYEDSVLAVARAPAGRVAIANTDSGGDAWAHFAIEHADRAVREVLS